MKEISRAIQKSRPRPAKRQASLRRGSPKRRRKRARSEALFFRTGTFCGPPLKVFKNQTWCLEQNPWRLTVLSVHKHFPRRTDWPVISQFSSYMWITDNLAGNQSDAPLFYSRTAFTSSFDPKWTFSCIYTEIEWNTRTWMSRLINLSKFLLDPWSMKTDFLNVLMYIVRDWMKYSNLNVQAHQCLKLSSRIKLALPNKSFKVKLGQFASIIIAWLSWVVI